MPLTGRANELAILGSAVASGTSIAVVGPAGVGKTRLCREVLQDLADGRHLVWLPVTEAAATLPLAPVAELLADGTAANRPELFAQAAAALVAEADGRPCVIAVDDAHLLDLDSVALLRHLAVTRTSTLALTMRSAGAIPDSVRSLCDDIGVTTVRLDPLQPAQVASLLQEWLRGPVLNSTSAWFAGRSAGYPLELRELVLAAMDSVSLDRTDGLWLLRKEPAPSARLTDLVHGRISSLPEQWRAALEELAVAEPLPMDMVVAIVGEPTLAALCDAGLAESFAGATRTLVRTAHPIIGEVVRGMVPVALQRRLRARLAGVMSAGGSPQDRMRAVSWQLDAGVVPGPAIALEAAAEAARQHDHDSALRLSGAVLNIGGGPAALVHARSLIALDRTDEALRLLERVDGSALSAEEARDLLGDLLFMLGIERRRDEQVTALLDQAEDWHTGPEWSTALVGIRIAFDCVFGRLVSAVERGAPLLSGPIEDTGHHAHDLSVMAGLCYALNQVGRTADAAAALAAVVGPDPATTMADHPLGRHAFSLWVLNRIDSGTDLPAATRLAHTVRARTVVGSPVDSTALLYLGKLDLARGHVASATRWLREAVAELGRMDTERQLGAALGALALALAWAGDPDNTAIARAKAYLAEPPVRYYELYLIARAEIWSAVGNGQLTRAGRLARVHAQACGEAFVEEAHLLHDMVRLGELDAPVLRRLTALAAGSDNPLLAAYIDHALAAGAHDGDALLDVAERFAAMTLDLLAAEAAAEASAAHRRAGRSATAGSAARRARQLIERCEGAHTPAMLGIYPRLDGTTRRERETVGLAVRGAPSAQIAAVLDISVRTVDSHLYRAMRKIGVRGRDELINVVGPMARG